MNYFVKKLRLSEKSLFWPLMGFWWFLSPSPVLENLQEKNLTKNESALIFLQKSYFFLQKLEIFLEGQKMTLKYFCMIPKHSNIKIKEQKDTNKLLVVIFWEF